MEIIAMAQNLCILLLEYSIKKIPKITFFFNVSWPADSGQVLPICSHFPPMPVFKC